MQKRLFGRLLQTAVDSFQVESGVGFVDVRGLVGNRTTALDESVDELRNKVFCKLSIDLGLLTAKLTDGLIRGPVVKVADGP